MDKAYLQAISYYFPQKKLTNEDLSILHPEWNPEKIANKTGIRNRYISADEETAVDMAEKAANALFDEYNVDKSIVDFIILCTQSPDYFLPTSACILQSRLSLSEKCGAFDYNLGCSGYVYGLGIAKGLVLSGSAKNVLLITSETYSKYLHPSDKSSQTIFGDAASASLITSQAMSEMLNAEIMDLSYKTIGSKYQSLIVPNGCSRQPMRYRSEDQFAEDGSFVRNDDYLFMDGKDIFEFSSLEVPNVVRENMVVNNIIEDDVNLFVFHQANKYMINFVRMRMKIDQAKFVMDLEDGGNTVSSTIPIALKKQVDDGIVKSGMYVLLCGFGVGLSIASVIIHLIDND